MEWEDERYEDNWFDQLKDRGTPYFQIAAIALDSLLDPLSVSHLKQRILDAITWYGQAVTEIAPAAKIVRSVAALERITVTKKTDGLREAVCTKEIDGLRETVSKRTALLCCEKMPEEYDKYFVATKKVYNCRSDLMHGSLSPFDDKLQVIASEALEIARVAILCGLEFFFALERSRPITKTSDLEKAYKVLEKEVLQTD